MLLSFFARGKTFSGPFVFAFPRAAHIPRRPSRNGVAFNGNLNTSRRHRTALYCVATCVVYSVTYLAVFLLKFHFRNRDRRETGTVPIRPRRRPSPRTATDPARADVMKSCFRRPKDILLILWKFIFIFSYSILRANLKHAVNKLTIKCYIVRLRHLLFFSKKILIFGNCL